MVKRENLTRIGDSDIFSEGCIDLGMSHGIIGVALFLAKAYFYQIIEEQQKEVIYDIINIYLNLLRENENGICMWPSQLGRQEFEHREWKNDVRENRVSWCYGNIGILRAMFLIGKYLNDRKLKIFSHDYMLGIANMQLEDFKVYTPILCHGYAGIIVIMELFYRETNEKEFREKINEIVKVEKKYFKEEFKHGFVNQGIVTVNEKEVIREIEQFDLLNSATGVILALCSAKGASTHWAERMFLV